MKTVTVDTNVSDSKRIFKIAACLGLDIKSTSVTDRELEGTNYNNLAKSKLLETFVFGESLLGDCVLGGSKEDDSFEEILNIISNKSFPKCGNRENLSSGELRQLRDAMIINTHAREQRDIFVSNDKKAYVKDERRNILEKRLGTKILTEEEFVHEFEKS